MFLGEFLVICIGHMTEQKGPFSLDSNVLEDSNVTPFMARIFLIKSFDFGLIVNLILSILWAPRHKIANNIFYFFYINTVLHF